VSVESTGKLIYSTYQENAGHYLAPPWEHLSNREREAWIKALEAAWDTYEPEPNFDEADPTCKFCGQDLECQSCEPPECPECKHEIDMPVLRSACNGVSQSRKQ
jgi:hypothetical protein